MFVILRGCKGCEIPLFEDQSLACSSSGHVSVPFLQRTIGHRTMQQNCLFSSAQFAVHNLKSKVMQQHAY
ncbi:hypothetical protein TYRP_017599 [Tyrophagus putrescentiae]|nr:hypothetical protein TYRP_017599 [Tyrophagus putrescentiae]